jgi:hypothetical protein
MKTMFGGDEQEPAATAEWIKYDVATRAARSGAGGFGGIESDCCAV